MAIRQSKISYEAIKPTPWPLLEFENVGFRISVGARHITFAPPPCLALISPEHPVLYHGYRTASVRLFDPEYLQRPGRPRRGLGRRHQRPPGIAALQDPLRLRQLLPHPQPAGQKRHRAGCAPRLYRLPAHDHPGGEPPQPTDRRARPAALRGCREENGGVPGPGPQAGLQGGHSAALCPGDGPAPAEDRRAGRPGVLHLQRAGCGKGPGEGWGEGAGGAEDAGGVLVRWP